MYRNLAPRLLGLSGCRDHELIELALTHRFNGINLNLERFQEQVRAKGIQQAKRNWTSARLRISSAELPFALDDPAVDSKALASTLAESLDSVRELNCNLLTTTISAGNDALSYQKNFEHHCRRLAEIAGMLADSPVRLGLAFQALPSDRARFTHSFIQTVEALSALIHLVGAPNIVAIVDVWQWTLGGGGLKEIERLGPDRIGDVILSDLPRGYSIETITRDQRYIPGNDGVIDAGAVLSLLAKMSYRGPVTPAADPKQLQAPSRDANIELIASRMDELMRLVGAVSITGHA